MFNLDSDIPTGEDDGVSRLHCPSVQLVQLLLHWHTVFPAAMKAKSHVGTAFSRQWNVEDTRLAWMIGAGLARSDLPGLPRILELIRAAEH